MCEAEKEQMYIVVDFPQVHDYMINQAKNIYQQLYQ